MGRSTATGRLGPLSELCRTLIGTETQMNAIVDAWEGDAFWLKLCLQLADAPDIILL